jgi:hypothetical protein
MIRYVQFSDVATQMFSGNLDNADMAYTWESVGLPERSLGLFEMARFRIVSSASAHIFPLVLIDEIGLNGLAVLRTRSGNRAWELAHLYFGKNVEEEGYLELLGSCVEHIANRGGERLFLRLKEGSAMERIAQLSGFRRSFAEMVYHFDDPSGSDRRVPYLNMRPLSSDVDKYNLFRLYNSAVPVSVRTVLGLTIDQWLSAQDYSSGRVTNHTWGRFGGSRCWVRTAQWQNKTRIEILLHPDEYEIAHIACVSAMQLLGNRAAMWIVPDYQPIVTNTLLQIGWSEIGRYNIFVKSITKEVGAVVESLVHA